MKVLLDSNIVIALLANDLSTARLLGQVAGNGVGVSVITYMEVSQGLHQRGGTNRAVFEELMESFVVISVDLEVAERCARLRADLALRQRSVRPRSLDLLIAATAIEHDLTLVTRNLDDYRDLPDLKLYPQ